MRQKSSPQEDQPSGSARRRGPSDRELVEQVAAGESLRSIAREYRMAHTTLGRRLQRPQMAAASREAKRRRRLEQQRERLSEKEALARAKEQAARDRQLAAARRQSPKQRDSAYKAWLDEREGPRGLTSAERLSRNDELAAQKVGAGGGIQELIEVTGLRTRLNVLNAVNPEVVKRALKDDRERPKEPPPAGRYSHFIPDDALIARRAAGEPLRSLATECDRSHSTLCRSFARPEVEAKLRAAQQRLLDQQTQQAAEQATLAAVAAHYASKVTDIWCPIHHRRVFVRGIDSSEGETRLEVAGCCPEATNELIRWLKIYRPTLPTQS